MPISYKSFIDVVRTVDYVMTGMGLVMLTTGVLMTATCYSHQNLDLLIYFITTMKQEPLFAHAVDCPLAEIHKNSVHQ